VQRLDVSGAVRPMYGSLGVKRLNTITCSSCLFSPSCSCYSCSVCTHFKRSS